MITLIAAIGRNGVIGIDGELPWSISADMGRFKRLTTGHAVVMGRTTFESIGRPLPARTNIVLTNNPAYRPDGVEVASGVEEAMTIAAGIHGVTTEIYIIGGATIYEQFLPLADRLQLTTVDAEPNGDAWFPQWDPAGWHEVATEEHEGTPSFQFRTLDRLRSPLRAPAGEQAGSAAAARRP